VTLSPLYAILDDQAAALAGWDPVELARAWFEAGVRLIQIRAKLASGARLLELCTQVGELAHAAARSWW
jgi:thiamine monophosphate synthase